MAGGKSGYKQTTIVLNDYSGSSISQRKRTNLKGKTTKRVSFEIKSEPIVHTFDDEALGRGPADALKEIISEQIRAISTNASTKTLLNRRYSQDAFHEGMGATDKKRYTGGRIGAKEPNRSPKLFNDSRRLAEGLAVGKNRQAAGERDWVVNVPANRFTEHTSHLAKQLFALVPALGKPSSLRSNNKLNEAVAESIGLLIAKAQSSADAKRLQLKQARRNALRAVLSLGRSVTGI